MALELCWMGEALHLRLQHVVLFEQACSMLSEAILPGVVGVMGMCRCGIGELRACEPLVNRCLARCLRWCARACVDALLIESGVSGGQWDGDVWSVCELGTCERRLHVLGAGLCGLVHEGLVH